MWYIVSSGLWPLRLALFDPRCLLLSHVASGRKAKKKNKGNNNMHLRNHKENIPFSKKALLAIHRGDPMGGHRGDPRGDLGIEADRVSKKRVFC